MVQYRRELLAVKVPVSHNQAATTTTTTMPRPTRQRLEFLMTMLAFLLGLVLTLSVVVLIVVPRCCCDNYVAASVKYRSVPGNVERARAYTQWVEQLPHLVHCGLECLLGEEAPEDARHDQPQSLPLPTLPTSRVEPGQCVEVPLNQRFDCLPEDSPGRSACEARGCCWQELDQIPPREFPHPSQRLHPPTTNGSLPRNPPLSVPFCYYPPSFRGYSFVNLTEEKHGLTGFLTLQAGSGYPGDAALLRMDVFYETNTRLRIKIRDATRERWEPPVPVVPVVNTSADSPYYTFKAHMSDGAFTVSRKSSNLPLFNTLGMAPLAFAEQFLQLSTSLPSNYIYGLGEHLDGLLLDTYWTRRTLWNVDQAPVPGSNLYGSHPFYLSVEPDGNTHGVFLLNSNAMDVVLQPHPALTFRAIGGILDLYVLLGPTPRQVVSQYTEVVGRPFLPPYWSLGYHQCKYGYGSLHRTREVWQRTRDAGIPFDVQWNDLDYMEDNKDFSYDHHKFAGLPEFVSDLHKVGMHYVPIIDPGISAGEPPHTYPPWDEGVALNIFVRNSSNMPFIGKVWNPVATVWPDFTHPLAAYYWGRELMRYHDQVPIDGAWIDMNEPSNFWSGALAGCEASSVDDPPYLPGVHGGMLYYHTLCMASRHYVGLHYNIHNLYGFTETIATNTALQIIRNKRPFIISRSTFPGQGHYGGHWTGDVWSDWFNLWRSIAGVLNFNMFGIPMVGADICGFNGNTTASLCLRWMQLGAFYPFSRNHNTDDGIDQDPVAMGEEVVVAARNALTQRYILLPYLYSLFFHAHLTGEPVARPLFFQFTKDRKTLGIDTQFMWGPGLMVVPALYENVSSVEAYLPHGLWYDWYEGQPVEGEGQYVTLDAPLDKIPLLVRGGSILPTASPANTTTASRQSGRGLLVAPDERGRAIGELYWDDGDSLDTVQKKAYTHIQFVSGPGIVSVNVVDPVGYNASLTLQSVTVLNVASKVTEVKVVGKTAQFEYDQHNKVLSIINFKTSLLSSFTVTWKLAE